MLVHCFQARHKISLRHRTNNMSQKAPEDKVQAIQSFTVKFVSWLLWVKEMSNIMIVLNFARLQTWNRHLSHFLSRVKICTQTQGTKLYGFVKELQVWKNASALSRWPCLQMEKQEWSHLSSSKGMQDQRIPFREKVRYNSRVRVTF